MKKLLSVILCLSLLLGYAVMTVSAQEEKLTIDVAADLHLDQESFGDLTAPGGEVDEGFAHVAKSGHLYRESKEIITAFLEKASKDDSKAILIAGDLTDTGLKTEMETIAGMFSKFEEQTGKQIYVVPGNHDVTKTDAFEFAKYFADFGYNEAIAKDSNSTSYVADLPDNYRLIAIDSTGHKQGGACIDSARLEWIRQQAEKAQQEGKKTIAMLHHNVLPHLVMIDIVHPTAVVDKSLGLKDMFAKYGVKYIFTGHTHENDIASYTAENGEVIYDVETGSMCLYPSVYRTVSLGEKVEIKTNRIESINVAGVPKKGVSKEALALMENNFTEYTKRCAYIGIETTLNSNFLNASYIKNLIKLDSAAEPEMSALIDKLIPKLKEAFNMPFYAESETEEGKSIENVLKAYNVTIPKSNYKNMMNLAVEIYEEHVVGDENKQAFSNEVVLASKGIGAVLAYTLSDVSAEEYTMALTYVCKFVGADVVPADLLALASDHIKRFDGIELVVSTAILPLILKVTVDEAPGDCNVTLPGYAELVEAPEAEKTFWEKVQDFFIKIFTAIMSIFAFMH